MSIKCNDFEREFRINALPASPEQLFISENRFSMDLDLTKLTAPKLYFFYAEKNNFCGILNVSKLPPSLMRVWVSGNGFKQDSLSVDATRLGVVGLWVDEGTFGEIVGVNGSVLKIQKSTKGLVISRKDEMFNFMGYR